MPVPRSAGYSGRSLIEKLGLKEGQRIIFIGAPLSFPKALGRLPGGLIPAKRLSGLFSFIQLFVRSRAELVDVYPKALEHLHREGALWISWPKKSSALAGDLSENILRDILLPEGVVDVKVCAIDETWSGLKFVTRRSLRK